MKAANPVSGLRVVGATLIAMCLAWCCTSCSAVASRPAASQVAASATPGRQLWVTKMSESGEPVQAVSPNGTRLFVSASSMNGFKTAAYNAATGALLWARQYHPAIYSNPTAIAVSPDGAKVYVTGHTAEGGAAIAYNTRTGKQLWARKSTVTAYFATQLAVSPDGRTVYVTGEGRKAPFAVIAYAAATGKQRWLRSAKRAAAAAVAVSANSKTVYVTSSGPVFTVAFTATGTLKWATRFKNPYTGRYDSGTQVVPGPGGNVIYVVGSAEDGSGHEDIATFAYRAATGKQLWFDRQPADLGPSRPLIAVTPDGHTVTVAGALNNGRTGYAALVAYSASTGQTRWTAMVHGAISNSAGSSGPTGLVIDPHGKTVIVGGERIAAYSVAHGTVQWAVSYPREPTAMVLSKDGSRLFAAGWSGRSDGSTIVAYRA